MPEIKIGRGCSVLSSESVSVASIMSVDVLWVVGCEDRIVGELAGATLFCEVHICVLLGRAYGLQLCFLVFFLQGRVFLVCPGKS